ncbi:hypothetical protein CDV36_009168 [Fusarium kuroshium]|uniref:Uncharacterized protein n=1 Tax=Fusarium kuroshium TaxID=2010991 RepID=A0A3M2S1L5_9HYPO|nr:hypothetical protein CDV36_009168 [Fusarium kuroshium]
MAGNSFLAISDYHLDGKRILSLAGFIRSGSPDIAAEYWIEVLPHSMPGTSLIWPTGTPAAERGRKGVFALCLLNDIRLIGFPSYHRRESWLQMIALSDAVARLTLRSFYAGQLYAPTFPYPRFWDSNKGGSFVAITGDAMTVGPYFKDMPLDTTIDTSSDFGPDVPLAGVLQSPIFDPVPYKPFLRTIAERNRMRMRLAQSLSTPQESLDFSPETGLLIWEGMSNEIAEAVEKGSIPMVLKQVQPVTSEGPFLQPFQPRDPTPPPKLPPILPPTPATSCCFRCDFPRLLQARPFDRRQGSHYARDNDAYPHRLL